MTEGPQNTNPIGDRPRTPAVTEPDIVDAWAPVLATMERQREPGCGDYPPTQDQRTQTRRRRERERKARLIAAQEEQRQKENAVLVVAATGASFQEIANQVGYSKTYVQKLYRSAMDRIGLENITEYREAAMHSLGVLHQAAFAKAVMAGPDQSKFMREARQIRDQMNRLHAAYPPVEVDISAQVTVTRSVTINQASRRLGEIKAAHQRADAIDVSSTTVPALNGNSSNGHGELT